MGQFSFAAGKMKTGRREGQGEYKRGKERWEGSGKDCCTFQYVSSRTIAFQSKTNSHMENVLTSLYNRHIHKGPSKANRPYSPHHTKSITKLKTPHSRAYNQYPPYNQAPLYDHHASLAQIQRTSKYVT